jgi:HEAT repeat protein
VVERALDVFVASRREDVLPLTERLLPHPEARVRAATVRARLVLGPDRRTLEACATDRDLGVALTARAGLVALGLVEGEGVREELTAAVRGADADTRETVARAIQVLPHPVLEPLLQELLADPESQVVLRAVAAAREMRSPALMGPLLLLLTRRAVREEARVALAAFGPTALPRLGEALVDPDLPHAIRRHVPGAIGMIGSAQAPELLLRHLRQEPDGMIRFKILRALGRWRNSQPEATLDGSLLQETLGQALNTGFRLMGWRRALVRGGESAPALRTELHQILVALLLDKQDHTLERVFRLLNLQTGSEEFQRVYRGLHSPREATRAGSRELLEHLVLPQVRGPLLTLVDDLHGGAASGEPPGWQSVTGANRGYARTLEELVGCGMESVSTLAVAHAAELGFGGAT